MLSYIYAAQGEDAVTCYKRTFKGYVKSREPVWPSGKAVG